MNPYRGNEGLVEQIFVFVHFEKSDGSITGQVQNYINEKRQSGFYLSSHSYIANENNVEFSFVFDKI